MGSTKSYEFVRDHIEATGTVDFVPMREEITTTYNPGSSQEVTLHDGSVVHLHKIDDKLDIHNRRSALDLIQEYKAEGKILTGLLYMDPETSDLHETIGTVNRPLRDLSERELCPGNNVLQNINAGFR
jgi:2-oxoglutarate/2-oxoacid ferredoxin oxidoreductase subunit beta